MSFRIAARTILQLGAELISSDAIAFYELIKNAFDAGSPSVDISIVSRVPPYVIAAQRSVSDESSSGMNPSAAERLVGAQRTVVAAIDPDAPGASDLAHQVNAVKDWLGLMIVLDNANWIEITDTGSGMSGEELKDVYLTIGTRSRLKQRESKEHRPVRPILGEKGIGRLSAMRLGDRLRVDTTTAGESHWNSLEVDWRWFSHNSDSLVGDVPVAVEHGAAKNNPTTHGTRIHISSLTSDFSTKKAKEIADTQFSKLTDPFTLDVQPSGSPV